MTRLCKRCRQVRSGDTLAGAGVELNSDGEEPDELKTDEEANERVLDGPNGCVVVAAKPEDGPKPGVVFDEVPNKDG
ncbi:unnamed protein product, partial [Brassica oleracea]